MNSKDGVFEVGEVCISFLTKMWGIGKDVRTRADFVCDIHINGNDGGSLQGRARIVSIHGIGPVV